MPRVSRPARRREPDDARAGNLGWKTDDTFTGLDESTISVQFGRFDYSIGNGMIINDGGSDGGDRGGWYIGMRKSFQNGGLISLDSKTAEGAALPHQEQPAARRYAGRGPRRQRRLHVRRFGRDARCHVAARVSRGQQRRLRHLRRSRVVDRAARAHVLRRIRVRGRRRSQRQRLVRPGALPVQRRRVETVADVSLRALQRRVQHARVRLHGLRLLVPGRDRRQLSALQQQSEEPHGALEAQAARRRGRESLLLRLQARRYVAVQ